ncbi:transposase [Magnetovibrio sp. PR-2]|uniref:transposase n=1 Tax=Magnetovibrio sp. PR-2 TaxID=3120356 RepID=UPI002FCE0F3D
MARLARVVVPGAPHHIIQRGVNDEQVFMSDDDYKLYIELMSEWCAKHKVKVLAYALMPNQVQLVVVPKTANGLARAIGEAHRRYARTVNTRENWAGYLWHGRFQSYPLDTAHTLPACAYVERRPQATGAAKTARTYKWSSAKAHLNGKDDALVTVAPMLKKAKGGWGDVIKGKDDADMAKALESHLSTGRPLGSDKFLDKVEAQLGRTLRPQKRGRKPKKG